MDFFTWSKNDPLTWELQMITAAVAKLHLAPEWGELLNLQ